MAIDLKHVLSSEGLPSLPTVALKVLRLVREPDTDTKEIVAVLKTDSALAAKVLRIANSSLYGFRHKVTSIDQAVTLLGGMAVNSVVLSFSLAAEAREPGQLSEYYQWVWRSALTQAAAAETLATQYRAGVPAEFFAVGLIQDIGVLALLQTLKEDYTVLLTEHVEDANKDLVTIEQEGLGLTHIDVGVELCRRWGLADTLVQAIREHHEIPSELAQLRGGPLPMGIIQATAATIGDFFCRNSNRTPLKILELLARELYQIDEETLHLLLEGINLRIKDIANLYSFDIGTMPSYEEILAQSKSELTKIALQANLQSMEAQAQATAAQNELQDLQYEEKKLRDTASRDPLTSVYNRLFFEEALAREFCSAVSQHNTLGLLFLDIDNFKGINDTQGHAVGDEVLREVARTIQVALRGSGIVARYGGDEFVAMVPHTTEEHISNIADRIRKKIESLNLRCDHQVVPVTACLGVALHSPKTEQENAHLRLIEAADQAMYHAKREGRNGVHLMNLENAATV